MDSDSSNFKRMTLRAFFLSLTTLLARPWKLLAGKCEPQEVFPTTRDNLIGLVVMDPMRPELNRYKVVSEVPEEFEYRGQTLCNYRRDKYWGYRVDDPAQNQVLLCIEKWHLYPDSYHLRFFKD